MSIFLWIFSCPGERPFKCQTCERTFTLKHSLVRHQRIHQKPQDSKGLDGEDEEEEVNETLLRDDMGSEEGEGYPCASGSESECTPCSTNPATESKMESETKESGDYHQAKKDGDENQEEAEREEEEEDEDEEEDDALVIDEEEKMEEEAGEAAVEETGMSSEEPSKESDANNSVSSEGQPGGASKPCPQVDDMAEAEKDEEPTQ